MQTRSSSLPQTSIQRRRDLPNFFRRVLARQRRSRHQVLSHREPSDHHWFIADVSDQRRSHRDRIGIVGRDRHPNASRLLMRLAHARSADRVERADNACTRKQFG